MATKHSEAFLKTRDLLLSLGDEDRRPIARLFGAVAAPESPPTTRTIELLRSIATLEDDDVLRFAAWCRQFLNRWGQVPKASGRAVDPRANRETARSPRSELPDSGRS
jgi:hypothetical protein